MTSRTFSTMNPNAIGPLLALDLGNLIVKTNADGLNRDRKVLGTVPRGVGSAFFEFYAYSDSQPSAGMGESVVVGVAKPHSALDAAVGDDADSFGLVIGTGDIGNGSGGPSVNPQSERVCIGVYINVDPISPMLTLNTNGSFLAEIALPAGEFWVPAVTVSGGTGAGDFKAYCNFGQRGFDYPSITLSDSTVVRSDGWYVENTEGIATIYFSIADEGFTTRTADTPSNKAFRPRILNPESFSIKRLADFWPMDDTSQYAAVGVMTIDNYDGAYDALLNADLRDSLVVMLLPQATPFAAPHTLDALQPIVTAVLDTVTSNNEDVITIALKDTLAEWDKQLPVRFNPPFVDSNAANRMVPITLGAVRNMTPQLIDQTGAGTGEPIYRLGDAQITNVAAARDMGANLDPNADPAQYRPALNGSGIQLQTPTVGKFTVDASSEGAQVDIPPTVDILGGAGELTAWPVAGSPPTGWAYDAHPGTIVRLAAINGYPQDYVASITTSSATGKSLHLTTPMLEPGKTYRITFNLVHWSGTTAPGGVGFLLSTSDSTLLSKSITQELLTSLPFTPSTFTYIYKVPTTAGSNQTIYAILVGTASAAPVNIAFYGLKVQELGEFIEQPLSGIGYAEYFDEILRLRGGYDATAWSAADLQAIDTETGYLFGMHITEPPNIVAAALRPVIDSFCGDISTDHEGTVRTCRLIDPHDLTPIAHFQDENVDRPISIETVKASNLTTMIGARRNWDPFSDSDFVTDLVQVPPDLRDRYKRASQYQRTATIVPAAQYRAAIGAAAFDSVLDNVGLDGKLDDAQTEIDRVVGLFSPKVYPNGDIHNGKRQIVQFTARWDSDTAIGYGTTCDVRDILIGSVVSLSYASNGLVPKFDNVNLLVVGTEIFPFAQKIVIRGFF